MDPGDGAPAGGGVMERLTYRDKDGFPMMKKRGGFKQGGVERLSAYEDTGLTPEEVERSKLELEAGCVKAIARTYGIDINRLRELAEADKDGRLVVLPCKPDGSMLNTSDPERPEIMKRIHFAVAYVCGGIVFHQPYNIFLENVAAGYIRPLNEKAEKELEATKDD